jgi:hypothetical protein
MPLSERLGHRALSASGKTGYPDGYSVHGKSLSVTGGNGKRSFEPRLS